MRFRPLGVVDKGEGAKTHGRGHCLARCRLLAAIEGPLEAFELVGGDVVGDGQAQELGEHQRHLGVGVGEALRLPSIDPEDGCGADDGEVEGFEGFTVLVGGHVGHGVHIRQGDALSNMSGDRGLRFSSLSTRFCNARNSTSKNVMQLS